MTSPHDDDSVGRDEDLDEQEREYRAAKDHVPDPDNDPPSSAVGGSEGTVDGL